MQKKHLVTKNGKWGLTDFEKNLAMWEKLGLRSAPLQGGGGRLG